MIVHSETGVTGSTCRFCDIASGSAGGRYYDQLLADTPSYAAVVSLGALVAGWILVLPKIHSLNLTDFYSDGEFVRLRQHLAGSLRAEFRYPVRIFEHGAVVEGSSTGCGVDHGHLHMVPHWESLVAAISRESGSWIAVNSSGIRDVVGSREYLFYSDDSASDDPNGLVQPVTAPVSQYFRRILAQSSGQSLKYNYQEHAFHDKIALTRERLDIRLHSDLRVSLPSRS